MPLSTGLFCRNSWGCAGCPVPVEEKAGADDSETVDRVNRCEGIDTEQRHFLGEYYTPEYERGLRHDDPALGIEWPAPITVISEKDASWPLTQGRHP